MLQRNVKEAKDVKSIPVQKRVIPFQTLAPKVLSEINSYLTLRDNINWRQTNLLFNMAYQLTPSYSQYKSFMIDYSNTISDEKLKQQLLDCFLFEHKSVDAVLNALNGNRAISVNQQIVDAENEMKKLKCQITALEVAKFKVETFCKAFIAGKKKGFQSLGGYLSVTGHTIVIPPIFLVLVVFLPVAMLISAGIDFTETRSYFLDHNNDLKNNVENALTNTTETRNRLKLLQFVMAYMHHLDKGLQESQSNFLINAINCVSDEKLKNELHTALKIEEKLIVVYKKDIEKQLKLIRIAFLKNINAYKNQLIKTGPWLSSVKHQAQVIGQKVVDNAKSSKTIAQKMMVPLQSYGIFVNTVYHQNSVNEKRSPAVILNEISQLMKEREALQMLLGRIQVLGYQEADKKLHNNKISL